MGTRLAVGNGDGHARGGKREALTRTVVEPPSAGLRAGVWRLADPKITLASAASLLLGASAAAADGPIAWGWLALTVAGIFFVEVAKNASGEVFDFDSGTDRAVAPEDRSPFSGGKRVLVDALLTRRQTWWVAAVGYALAALAGLWIALVQEPSVWWLGLAGLACAWFYHAPPLKLSYRGLGELAVAFCYGPLIAAGAYLVQRGQVGATVILPALPLGLAIAAFLWINEFPDCEADRAAGKRTLVVRLGRGRASRAFAGIVALTFLGVLLLPLAGLPGAVLLGLAGLPSAIAAARRLWREPVRTARVVPAQAWTLWSFLLLAAGVSLGLLIGASDAPR
jgi:1,4-dihydroxy-2-naphthoate octaprenyltransferase